MSDFIGWQWVVIAMSIGAIVGHGLTVWQLRRELRKEEEMRK